MNKLKNVLEENFAESASRYMACPSYAEVMAREAARIAGWKKEVCMLEGKIIADQEKQRGRDLDLLRNEKIKLIINK